jgi:hypothetical protein
VKYEEKLASQLKNPQANLWWEDTYPLRSLTEYAHVSFEQNTSEGVLAATMIFHQLAEELIRITLRYDNLLVRASIYPNKINERTFTKEEKFYVLIKKLTNTVEFKGQKKMIALCKKINNIRNTFSHKLIGEYFYFQNDSHNSTIVNDFNALFECWTTSINWYNKEFEIIMDREEIQLLLKNS